MSPHPHGFIVDMTNTSGVVICPRCGWRALVAPTRLAAWRAAVDHEHLMHPELLLATSALEQARRRMRRL